MRFNLRLTILAVVLLIVGACTGVSTWTPPAGCDASNSVILEKIPNPYESSLLLQIANVELLKRNVYSAEQAMDVVEHIEGYLQFGITWADFIPEVVKLVGTEYAGEVFVLSGYIDVFAQQQIPISKCDRQLILAHLEKQKRVIELYL